MIDTIAPTDNTANLQFSLAYENTGNNIAVNWNAFSDVNLTNHRIKTYTDSGCSVGETDHGVTGSTSNSDSIIIDSLTNGSYYATVTAIDAAGNSTTSACSTDSIIIDLINPTDNTANIQFTNDYDQDGNDLAVTWTAFTDTNLSDHRLYTYTNSGCSIGVTDHGLTGSTSALNSTLIDGLSDGQYWAQVRAIDAAGNTTLSARSTDSIFVDSTPPTDNLANLQFTDIYDNDGNDIVISWTAFTDTHLADHRIKTYTDSSCSTNENDHGLTGSSTATNSTIVDGLADGIYYATVTAYDQIGNSTTSSCSTDTIVVDSTNPTDNTANLQFTNAYSQDGNNIAVTWIAFTDVNLSDHRIYTFEDSSCTTGEIDHGLTGSIIASNNTIIDGLTDGQYWAKVRSIDAAGNTTLSACSSDSIIIDTNAPTDNGADFQFTAVLMQMEMILLLLGRISLT